ncbi:MAG: OmpH family outer membrane protein [Alphaproteobacteria bacterium]|jgi:Skp family chaperone for outer membrane proteins
MMVRCFIALCALLPLLPPLAGAAMAAAKGSKPAASIAGPVIAVLDVQQVLRRAAAAKSIRLAMDAKRKAFEAEISTERKIIQAAEQKLRKQSTILSPEAINEKRRELENNISDFRRKAEQRRGTLNRAFTGATRILRNEMAKVLAALMKERKITITLARKAVLVFDQRLNVTDEVLRLLDKSLPTIALDFKNPDQK